MPATIQRLTMALQQQCRSDWGPNHQQWQQSQAYMQTGGAQVSRLPPAAAYPRNQLWTEGTAFDHDFTFSGRPHMSQNIPQLNASLYGNRALAYPESASSGFGNSGSGGSTVSWPTPESLGLSGSMRNDTFDRGIDDSLSPKSYNSETQASEAQPFTPKSIPSTASVIGDWSCGSAQPYTAIKASSPNAPNASTWGNEHGAAAQFSGLQQHGLDVGPPMAQSIGSSQGFHGLPDIYSDTSQHGPDHSYSQQSSPAISPGFHGGSTLMPRQSNNLLARSAPDHGLSNREQAQASNGSSYVPTPRDGSLRSVPRREDDRAQSNPESASDFHAQRRADDAILLEGKRNGLTYKDIRKKLHKKCAESTLRGRYRSLTKARQERVRKPVWREKDVSLLCYLVIWCH